MPISSIQTPNLQASIRQDDVSDIEDSTVTNYCFSEKYDKPIMVFQWLSFAIFIMVACRVGDGNEVTSNPSADYFLMAAMVLLTVSPFIYKYISANCVKQSQTLQETQMVRGMDANLCEPTMISSPSEPGRLTIHETFV